MMVYNQSPHSSSGAAGSSEGTPDTRFTAFSPEDARPIKVSTQADTKQRATQQDPFVTSSGQVKAEQKLSATASDFKPFSSNLVQIQAFEYGSASSYSATAALPQAAENLRFLIDQMPGRGSTVQPGSTKSVLQGSSSQFGIFSTDTNATRCFQVTSVYKNDISVHQTVFNSLEAFKKRGFKRIGSERIEKTASSVLLHFSNIRDAAQIYTALKLDLPQYTVEYISPAAFAAAVKSPSKVIQSAHEAQVILIASYPTGTPCNKKVFEEGLIAVLSAEGDLFAWQKQAATSAGTYRMVVEYEDAAIAIRAVDRLNGQHIKLSQGDVVLALEFHTPDVQQPTQHPGNMITPTRRSTELSSLADTLGRLSLNSAPNFPGQRDGLADNIHSSILPYMTSNASAFGMSPNQPPFMGGMYGAPVAYSHGYPVTMHHQYLTGSDNSALQPNGFGQHNLALVESGFDHRIGQIGYQQSYEPSFGLSNAISQRGDIYLGRNGGRRSGSYMKFSNYGPRRNYGHHSGYNHYSGNGYYPESDHAAGQHNQVDINRIKQGIDVRTTVMLRNIPNKIDQSTLKQIVDESSFGRYDFMYLRIDFSNDCNVGYAFINFVDPLNIIDFVLARSNQKWHMFKSDKVAEVSYATIQGRDCLIQKFRNSSVMLEPAHYRPKLFWTVHDQGIGTVGQEEEFPASDNSSKLRRSCENAEHVGLFAPNAGQQLRDDQRRRRSQFDRGTTLAEREEEYYVEEEQEDEQDPRHPSYRRYKHHR